MPHHIAPEVIIDCTLYALLLFSVGDFFQNLGIRQ
jgi:hypothetical protein